MKLPIRNARQQQENERGRDKLMSLFPGVFITVTVEGSYQNLRRFMREIETTQQFIMISSVELVPADKQKENKTEQQRRSANRSQIRTTIRSGQFPSRITQQRLDDVYAAKRAAKLSA